MKIGIAESPIFGNGANSSEAMVSSITDGLTHPHNDWLRLAYDYGYFGAIIFALSVIAQTTHAFRKARSSFTNARMLLYAGASSMIIFMLFMLTDNIILYASFFGNFQFTVLGLGYGAYQQSSGSDKPTSHSRKRRIRW
jgi:O-antigen ligase